MIQVSNLTKTYPSLSKPVINAVNLSIAPNSFVSIMGSSGSGKSTLLFLLSGLDFPTKGQIWLNGQLLNGYSEKGLALFRRKQLGFVFQDHHLINHLTLLENTMLPALLSNNNRKAAQKQAEGLLKQLGIYSLKNRLPSEVSGGERQGCAIARALINQAPILMADEPTGNLNARASRQVMDIFSQLHQQGQSILLVTHDINTAIRGERIIYLKDGKIEGELVFPKALEKEEKEKRSKKWLLEKGW